MINQNIKIGDCVIAKNDNGELEINKKYIIHDIHHFSKANTTYLCLIGLLWTYEIKNFITLSEYRKIKIKKINTDYEL